MNIYEKINAIMEEVKYLQKDDKVSFGSTNYKALSEEKVTTLMREKLIKHKLIVYPVAQTSRRDGNISHVDVSYRMVNVENPEEYIEIASSGDGADTQDKGSGKAMTYAFKYMWLRTFALPTGEDPDKISSEELDAKAQEEAVKAQPIVGAIISEKEAHNLTDLVLATETNMDKFLNHFKVKSIELMTKRQYAEAVELLGRKGRK